MRRARIPQVGGPATPAARSSFWTLCWGSLAACAALSCGPEAPRAHGKNKNIVLVVMDTVRADHLSCYGYGRRTTPGIDAFAAGADRYDVARSVAPWTLPSHASLFTGLLPNVHGADAMKLPSGSVADAIPLPEEELTLAEALSAGGYRAGAFAANRGYVNPRMGLAQGFDPFMNDRHDAREMSRLAVQWIDGLAKDQPWFLFVNYMDAHRPYNNDPLPPGRMGDVPTPPEGTNSVALLDSLIEHVFLRATPPSAELVQSVIDCYDLGLAHVDLGVTQLLADLGQRGLLDDALVVLTADHGEYFGEHDLVEHSKDIYEPVLRVPLIIKRPQQRAGRVIDTPTSLVDVPGWILRDAAPAVAAANPGRFKGSADLPGVIAEVKYARGKDLNSVWGPRFDREREAIVVENYKLIRSSDGQNELFDLATDPNEQHNLYAEKPQEAAALMGRLKRLLAASPRRANSAPVPELTAEERRAMAELGYVDLEEEPKPPQRTPPKTPPKTPPESPHDPLHDSGDRSAGDEPVHD